MYLNLEILALWYCIKFAFNCHKIFLSMEFVHSLKFKFKFNPIFNFQQKKQKTLALPHHINSLLYVKKTGSFQLTISTWFVLGKV